MFSLDENRDLTAAAIVLVWLQGLEYVLSLASTVSNRIKDVLFILRCYVGKNVIVFTVIGVIMNCPEAMSFVKVNKKTNSVAWVHERTIPTELPPLVGEVSANFCG
jgi:hypothetical protein